MQDSEKQKFEDSWKKAFDGAEMTPPDRVWSSIELDIAGQESAAMKKRVVFYQRLAAAMVLFALGTGIYAFYPKDVTMGRGEEMKSANEIISKPKVIEEKIEVKETKTEIQPVLLVQMEPEVAEPIVIEEVAIEPEPEIVSEIKEDKKEDKKEETVAVVSPLLQQPEQTEQPEEVVQPKKRSRESNLWLALGASAGNYSPNTPSATTVPQNSFAGMLNSFADPAPQKRNEPKVGQSFSLGMSVGKKFGRIVVQTGLSLGRQQVEYTSNYDAVTPTNASKAASSDYLDTQNQSFSMAITNTEYTVNSTMEIISIPVQAGYMIIDRKLGWQLNAGVSPDFFLKNVLEDESGKRERFSQSAGAGSPYRSVNWSGLLNTELSYRLGQHYRLSLVPGVRYSFNSILKEPTNNGRPVILDVGFRFRYLFE